MIGTGNSSAKPRARVLVVDDDPAFRNLVDFHFQRAGLDSVTAADPVEALDWTDRERFDLVVTDYCMPRLTGLDLVRQLRESDRHTFTPIIMVTGKADHETLTETCDRLSILVLLKPCSIAHLVEVACRYVAMRSDIPRAAEASPSLDPLSV